MSYRRSERSNLKGERQLGALNGYGQMALGGVLIVIELNIQLGLGLFGHQVGADERVDVAVHDTVDVPGTELGMMVFDHPVGLHHVGSNLAAEGNIQLALVEFVGVGLTLLNF